MVDILAVGIHPDDVELSCSGTLLAHKAKGYSIGVLDLSAGELGTRGNAEIRASEASEAAKILGLSFRDQLNFKDGFFCNDEEHQLKLIEKIRFYKPKIVLANAISDRHPDHGRAAKLISDSCFYSGLSKIQTNCKGDSQTPWRPTAVYHYIQDHYIHPDFVIDVSDFAEQKRASIMAYKSQFFNPDSKEPQTPISSPEFIESLFSKMSIWGRAIGVKYAEGFTVCRYPGVEDLFQLK